MEGQKMNRNYIKPLFIVAGLYDALLGLIFFFAHDGIFQRFEITPANHPAYIEFPALLLIIFGAMFLQISSDPDRFRFLILYGMALKVCYASLAFWYQITSEIPFVWVPWAWADLVFLIAFYLAWKTLSDDTRTA